MLSLGAVAYMAAYQELLAALDPDEIASAIGAGSVMLLWERDPADCHRTMVARFLQAAGHDVEEIATDFAPQQLTLFQ
jgi:hypothetical protein